MSHYKQCDKLPTYILLFLSMINNLDISFVIIIVYTNTLKEAS